MPSLTSSQTDIDEVLANARRNSLTRDNPALADLPDWFEQVREHQRVAIREVLTAYEEGAKCVVLDAPTGAGKTGIAEVTRRLLPDVKQTTYICSSKALQDQVLRDYPYAKVLKGRSNYATISYPERFGGHDGLSCADCTKTPGDAESCLWCPNVSDCSYERTKSDALRSSLAVLNTSYYLSECNGPGRFSRGGFIIADECDSLESELLSHVEVRISEKRLKSYGLRVPKYVTKEESWREWAEEAYEKVKSSPLRQRGNDVLLDIREAKRHSILVQKLSLLRDGLANGGWVYVGDRQSAAFKPVTVDKLGQDKFWRHGGKFLLMSATVISADEMLESLGWDEDKEWRLVKVPSTFPPENRKVVVWPCASMTYKEKDVAYPKMIAGVKEVLSRHPDERVLVHSTSYELTRSLEGGMGVLAERDEAQPPHLDSLPCRPTFTYVDSAGKDATLIRWLASPNGVLIAPSFDRGIDLPNDLCRCQIICKIPYLSLKDKQVSARKWAKGGQLWYSVSAIRTIVQMCGRIVRGEDDWGVTYLLDGQFGINLWPNNKRLFPQWWKDALVWKTKGL